jgi:GNAT superfamily N-acetyltransferase
MSVLVRRGEASRAQAAHQPDAHWVAIEGGAEVARCSLWWRQAPPLDGERTAAIGHFAAAPGAAQAARALLERACRELRAHGATLAVGPMDGNTWRSYRLVSDAGQEPPFFLEPWNPPEWNAHFTAAGFTALAGFHSSATADLATVDERIPEAAERLRAGGVKLRSLDPARFVAELARIHALSLEAFARNFMFTPLTREEFVAQYRPIEAHVDPRLVLLAERDGELAGFLFAVPDVLQAQRGEPVSSVVVKTVAVRAGRRHAGLGAWLAAECHARAAAAGLRRAVHALMHDANNSANISRRYAGILRRYTLYARRLDGP